MALTDNVCVSVVVLNVNAPVFVSAGLGGGKSLVPPFFNENECVCESPVKEVIANEL